MIYTLQREMDTLLSLTVGFVAALLGSRPILHKLLIMAQARVFTLIGDSNIQRHVNKTSHRASPVLKASQVLFCGHIGIFRESLDKVRSESNVCVFSCFTNFLASADDGPDTVAQRIDPVLQDVRQALDEVCAAFPLVQFLISPPMYRTSPFWYREGLPEILTLFSQTFYQDRPANLHLLSSFPTPEYGKDGVHLTPYAGLEFLLHLIDGAQELLDGLEASPDVVVAKASEGARVLEDRMMALEQDHRRLNSVVESKTAADAESSNYRDNLAAQDSFVILGLPLIPPDVVGKPWQDRAIKDVNNVIKLLMGRPANIIFVKNSTPRHKDAEVTYIVKVREVSESEAIRDKFGGYFVGNVNRLPENLKGYSIRNLVTPQTKVRIAVLQVLARRYRDSNLGSKVQVVGYEPRPRMKITPAANATDKRVMVYNYIEAVKNLPTTFTSAEEDFIFKKINPKWVGTLRSLFICISDDAYRKKRRLTRGPATGANAVVQGEDAPGDEVPPVVESADSEMEVVGVAEPQVVASGSRGGRGGRGGNRNNKRGASSSPESSAPAKK